MSSLDAEYQQEQARCRQILDGWKAIGPAGVFGAHRVEQVLKRAERAIASRNFASILTAIKELRTCK